MEGHAEVEDANAEVLGGLDDERLAGDAAEVRGDVSRTRDADDGDVTTLVAASRSQTFTE